MAELDEKFEVMQMEQAAGQSSSSGAGASSVARAVEVEVPDEYVCPITSELMSDPVVTVGLCHHSAYPRPHPRPRHRHQPPLPSPRQLL